VPRATVRSACATHGACNRPLGECYAASGAHSPYHSQKVTGSLRRGHTRQGPLHLIGFACAELAALRFEDVENLWALGRESRHGVTGAKTASDLGIALGETETLAQLPAMHVAHMQRPWPVC